MCTFAGLKQFESVFVQAIIGKCTVQRGHFTAANEHALTLPDISSFMLSIFGGHFKIVNISFRKESRS
jgi:hypothetical protein